MKKNALILLLGLSLLLFGCAPGPAPPSGRGILVVATLFPQYDFAREIAKDKMDIVLLLPPGVESHSFEPSPADIMKIEECSLFLYTGDGMEPWARTMIGDADLNVVDLSQGITLLAAGEDGHDPHDGHGQFDPHIWTDPQNAILMVESIAGAICGIDPGNEEFYRKNANEYIEKLLRLDESFEEVVNAAKVKTIAFGGRFALAYFAERYGLTSACAYDACSDETEPSVAAVARVVDTVRELKLPVVYYEELSEPNVARAISEETGAKMLLLHSVHNLSRDEMERGEGYLSLMEKNLENLKEGLGA